jgi:Tfp pilus assembly protein PilF
MRYSAAVDALNKGDWKQAQRLSMQLLREVPPHAGVCFVAGVAARELMQIPLALQCLQRAVELNPVRPDYLAQFAQALSQANEPRAAVEIADRAAALQPSDPLSLDTLGFVYSQVHAETKAAGMFRRLVELQPRQARHRFNYATSLIQAGDVDAAERELEACLIANPCEWKAYLSRALLRKQTQVSNHLENLRDALPAAAGDALGELCVNMALSKEYEDVGEFQASFKHLLTGKAAFRATRAYSSQTDVALFDAIKDGFRQVCAIAGGDPNEEPIFVIGMPRTGTTLVDRILSSHRDVSSAGELQNFGVQFKRATGSVTSPMLDLDTLGRVRQIDWTRLGRQYVESTRPLTGSRRRFVDKLPHNFLLAGFIAKALPNARIICLRRDPMDSCLSNFRQLFALGSSQYDYSFDLLDTGRYFVEFARLVAFWKDMLPGRILDVGYESLVSNQEAGTRRLLEFCGLDWDPACLDFHKNVAPVATASAVQVRAPMNSESVHRWKRYGSDLTQLKSLLVAAGVEVAD